MISLLCRVAQSRESIPRLSRSRPRARGGQHESERAGTSTASGVDTLESTLMHQPDRSEKRNVRHSPYERIVLPDSVRRDLVKYVSDSSPLRGSQPSRQAEKQRTRKSSPVKVKKEPSESDPQYEAASDSSASYGQLTSDEDDTLLEASSRLAHDTIANQRKHVGSSTSLGRRPVGQAIAEQNSMATVIGKGKRPDPEYSYGVPPSSLSAGPSSATWVSRPSEDLNRGVNIQPADLERFTVGMNNLIDEFCVQAKTMLEEFTNRGR